MSNVNLEKLSRPISKAARSLLLFTVALIVATTPSLAENAFDRGTPAESKGGLSSLSSYAPDKIETVNLANHNLNLNIPLVTVGDRGSASYTVSLAYNCKVWTSQHDVEVITDPFGGQEIFHHYGTVFGDNTGRTPNLIVLGSGWSILKAPAIKVTPVGIKPLSVSCPNLGNEVQYGYIVTRVWLVLPDGSEIALRDDLTDGAPLVPPRASVWPTKLMATAAASGILLMALRSPT